MPRQEWGSKHRCEDCGARFYDLERSTIKCPRCGKPVVLQSVEDLHSRRKNVVHQAASDLKDHDDNGDDGEFDTVDDVESVSLENIQDVSTEDID